VDPSALPTRTVLRWDLAVRIGLAILGPLLVQYWLTGEVLGTALITGLAAALISLSSLGPETAHPRWIAVAAVGTPVAVTIGQVLGPSATGGALWAFVLYLVYGALAQAGLVAQLAWFPVSTAGLMALVSPGQTSTASVAASAAAGAVWAVVLMLLVPRVVRVPRLPVPAGALEVDVARLRRMVRHPSATDWGYPLLLGALATALLVVVNAVTGGFKPYWAVFALVGVLAPTAVATRRSTWETVASTLGGIFLAAILLAAGLAPGALLLIALAMGLVGAVLLLRSGTLSKLLLTPLPVIAAAMALGPESGLALSMRLAEYLLGAGVGFVAALCAEWLSQQLSEDRPQGQSDVAA
jgi:Fusaric acid resistance protein-like